MPRLGVRVGGEGAGGLIPELATSRLRLRAWRDDDREPYAALNADLEVMRWFPAPLTREQSDAHVDRIGVHFAEHGFGLWAVEVVDGPPFIGFVGLAVQTFAARFTPCVEVGWRLARAAWGDGYASEAARECLRFGFEDAGLDEILSFTTTGNEPSQRVMQRIGMVRDPAADFDHPNIPADHALVRHVLYRITRPQWELEAARERR